jgi:hypothetical protein
METIDRAQTVTDLRAAADIIERNGWHQGNYFLPDDPKPPQECRVCALGAIHVAIHGQPWSPMFDSEQEDRTLKAFAAASRFVDGPWGSLVGWNDEPDRTAEEVIAALRGAADSIDPEGAAK